MHFLLTRRSKSDTGHYSLCYIDLSYLLIISPADYQVEFANLAMFPRRQGLTIFLMQIDESGLVVSSVCVLQIRAEYYRLQMFVSLRPL
jgi:hypothetical protein